MTKRKLAVMTPKRRSSVLEGAETGDLVYGRGNSAISRMIVRLTEHEKHPDAAWSHVGVMVDNGGRIVDQTHFGRGFLSMDEFCESFEAVGWTRLKGVNTAEFVSDLISGAEADQERRDADPPSRMIKSRFGYSDLAMAAAVMIRARLRRLGDILGNDSKPAEKPPPPEGSSGWFRWRVGGDPSGDRVCAGFVYESLLKHGPPPDLTWPEYVRITSCGQYVFDRPEGSGEDRISLAQFLWNMVDDDGAVLSQERIPETFSVVAQGLTLPTKDPDRAKRKAARSRLVSALKAAPYMATFLDPRYAIPVGMAIGPNELWTAEKTLARSTDK